MPSLQKSARNSSGGDSAITSRAGHEAGFSALEALVAVAIVAIALLPLVAIQGDTARQAAAIVRTEGRLAYREAALERVSVLNPMVQPEGAEPLGEAQLVWTAIPVTEVRVLGMTPGISSRFEAAVFSVEMRIELPSGDQDSFSVHRLGTRAVRPMAWRTSPE